MIILRKGAVGWKCGRHRRGQKCIQGFDGETRQKETAWKTYIKME
jgi:hypothetical protein